MKVIRFTTKTLNSKEYSKLSDNIIDALYELNPEIQDLYDIHINYIDDTWVIDFLPSAENIPVIKVETYTDYSDDGDETLKIVPKSLEDLPEVLKFKDEDRSYDLCMNYVTVFEYILSLYDFEYKI